jgi:hypothetical protein
MIVSENFQDWPNTRTYSASPLDCNLNNRISNFNWQDIRIHRPSAGETEAVVNFYLIGAEIQPFCDTQSGTDYLTDTTINTGTKLVPTNPGVSSGNICLYDSTFLFPTYAGTTNTVRKGAFIVGQVPSITLIQYTTSSFGARRGFKLDYSIDRGITWTLIRKEHGKSLDSTVTTSGYQLPNSPKGVIWEDNITLEDAMLRFTINDNQPQIARIHDIRIFGNSPLREDMDDTEYETNSGIVWGNWLGVNRVTTEKATIQLANGMLRVSGNPVWTKVNNLAGQCVRVFANEQMMNLSDLNKGVYLIQSKDMSGLVSLGKICL